VLSGRHVRMTFVIPDWGATVFDEVAAAWVQAVGTLIALVIAIAAPIIHERIRERADHKRLLTGVAALVAEAASQIEVANRVADTDEQASSYVSNYGPTNWDHFRRKLDAFPLHATADAELAFNVLEVQSFVHQADQMIRSAKSLSGNGRYRRDALQEIKPIYKIIVKQAQALVEVRKLKARWWRPLPTVKPV
jgi:hypothetical protein